MMAPREWRDDTAGMDENELDKDGRTVTKAGRME